MRNRWERTPWLCWLGLHRWRRKPVLVEDDDLDWRTECTYCGLDLESLRGVAE